VLFNLLVNLLPDFCVSSTWHKKLYPSHGNFLQNCMYQIVVSFTMNICIPVFIGDRVYTTIVYHVYIITISFCDDEGVSTCIASRFLYQTPIIWSAKIRQLAGFVDISTLFERIKANRLLSSLDVVWVFWVYQKIVQSHLVFLYVHSVGRSTVYVADALLFPVLISLVYLMMHAHKTPK
jgi:hypothetical protein